MASKYTNLLDEGLAKLGINLDLGQRTQLDAYIAEIELFNPVYKLVGAEGDELIIRHILDSLAGCPTMTELASSFPHARIADLGSGAGLPGIPLAIAMRSYEFTLVERMGRRVDFLRNALVRCSLLDRVSVFDRDLKEVKQQFDLITFRAFHPLYEILDLVAPILSEGGVVCAYKAQMEQVQEELEQVKVRCKSRWQSSLVELDVPRLEASRMLCLLKKI
jgi:16S rRNA (guanine527-N7)-methyltransferase